MDKFEKRAAEIVSKLTEEEKINMLSTHQFAVERLGMDEFYIGTEVARGYVGREPEKISTVFPQPIGLAATFDRELLQNTDCDTLLIDLASLPGGVDFDAASPLRIDAQRALSLPGKCAPKTAGEIIKTTVFRMIEEVNR